MPGDDFTEEAIHNSLAHHGHAWNRLEILSELQLLPSGRRCQRAHAVVLTESEFNNESAIARKRREKLARSIADVALEIERAQAEVTEAFQELKRYEQALANRQSREATERLRDEMLSALSQQYAVLEEIRRSLKLGAK